MANNVVLEMSNITKVYPNGVIANENVDFEANEGEIHALMGENGAGKSTLMKILFGSEHAESGTITLRNEEIKIDSPLTAIKHGIGMVHQHFMLDENLTVIENVVLGMEPKKGMFIDFNEAEKLVTEASKRYNFNLNPKSKIADLNVSQRQKVEILKVLVRGAKIIIMDEPTAVLTPQETSELFEQLQQLKQDNHTIIFISHKLKEIKEICDRITVMRMGRSIGTYNVADVTIEDISRLMIGRDLVKNIEKKKARPGNVILEAKNISVNDTTGKTVVDDISLLIREGEILGIAAIEGNGQRELIDVITGLAPIYHGTIIIDGEISDNKNATKDRRDKGLTHIPEDRLVYGTIIDASIRDNLMANRYNNKKFSNKLSLKMNDINEESKKLSQEYQVKTNSIFTPIKMLSGGNMQKVVAAREMSVDMKLLVADQPTRGIDVGSASFIHENIIKLRDKGVAVLLSSADINEVLELSDKLVVLYNGKITGYFENAKDVDEKELGLYMLGLKNMDHEEVERLMYAKKAN